MTAPTAAPGENLAAQRDPRLRLLIPMIVAIAFLMEQLDSTILTTAIPDMSRSLATAPVRMNLAVSAYVLTLAVFIPVSGWFADRFGARRIFGLALTIFTAGSALCGLANSFPVLVATRILQGLGGAMMTPVGRLILLEELSTQGNGHGHDLYGDAGHHRADHRPPARRILTTYASWRWIFYVNLPFGLDRRRV